jgi:hypothetical protein
LAVIIPSDILTLSMISIFLLFFQKKIKTAKTVKLAITKFLTVSEKNKNAG